MTPATRSPRALRFDLTVPTTQVRVGPFAFDGVGALIGVPLADLLGPLLRDAVHQRTLANGAVVDVYPLSLPDGEGLSVPIRLVGELGLRNHQGLLVVGVPPAMAPMVQERLRAELAAGQAAGPRLTTGAGGNAIAEFGFRLVPGMRKAMPIGTIGEFGVEAA